MYKIVEKKECKKCSFLFNDIPLDINNRFCTWGKAKKKKKIVPYKGKNKPNCKLIKKGEINIRRKFLVL